MDTDRLILLWTPSLVTMPHEDQRRLALWLVLLFGACAGAKLYVAAWCPDQRVN